MDRAKRVIFEYGNGEVKYLEGKEFKKWFGIVNSALFFKINHGMKTGLEKVNWKKARKVMLYKG